MGVSVFVQSVNVNLNDYLLNYSFQLSEIQGLILKVVFVCLRPSHIKCGIRTDSVTVTFREQTLMS